MRYAFFKGVTDYVYSACGFINAAPSPGGAEADQGQSKIKSASGGQDSPWRRRACGEKRSHTPFLQAASAVASRVRFARASVCRPVELGDKPGARPLTPETPVGAAWRGKARSNP